MLTQAHTSSLGCVDPDRLCVNENVARPQRSAARVNEVCLDLQRQAADDSKHRGGCAYLSGKSQQRLTDLMKVTCCWSACNRASGPCR